MCYMPANIGRYPTIKVLLSEVTFSEVNSCVDVNLEAAGNEVFLFEVIRSR